jgi:hypothetical protein
MRLETERQEGGVLPGSAYEQKWWLEQQHEWPLSALLPSVGFEPTDRSFIQKTSQPAGLGRESRGKHGSRLLAPLDAVREQ